MDVAITLGGVGFESYAQNFVAQSWSTRESLVAECREPSRAAFDALLLLCTSFRRSCRPPGTVVVCHCLAGRRMHKAPAPASSPPAGAELVPHLQLGSDGAPHRAWTGL